MSGPPPLQTQSLNNTQGVVTPSQKVGSAPGSSVVCYSSALSTPQASQTDPPVHSRSLSDLFKFRAGPEREYLTRSDSHSEEVCMFWEMVHRIGQQFCPLASECLQSPVIAESLYQRHVAPTGKRRGTISLTNRGLVTVAIETSGDVPPTVFNCDGRFTEYCVVHCCLICPVQWTALLRTPSGRL